jgi:N-acetylmuramoyl-L-alanine amidase
MDRRNFTRRDALRLGAGAVAVSALRLPSPASAAAPPLFDLEIPHHLATAASAGWRTTAPLAAPRRFDMVGLVWAPGQAIDAQVRARRRGGRWSAWLPLPALDGHAPDGEEAPSATDPAFTGAADELQLRLRGQARGLKARLLHALAARPAARAAQVAPPSIIPRAAWGADAVPPRAFPEYGIVEAAFVHHTVGTNAYGPGDSAGIVLGIARYHVYSNGWNDIGYNFLVDKYGQVFEGRAGGIDAAVVGAQAQGYNAQSTGIANLGTFSGIPQTDAAMEAMARLIGWKLSLHGVPVQGPVTLISDGGPTNRYRYGTQVPLQRISGHRDGDNTECPGAALYAQLGDLRTRAATYAGPVTAIVVRAASSQQGATPVNLEGVLRFANGASPAGAALAIEYAQPGGSAWTPVATTVSNPDGSWAASAVLPASGNVRAAFGGDAARPPVTSGPISVLVVPTLSLTADKTRAVAGTPFRLSGAISPPQARLTCLLERQVGRRWKTVQRKRIAVVNGSYATSVRPRRAGLYRVSIGGGGVTKSRRLRATRA